MVVSWCAFASPWFAGGIFFLEGFGAPIFVEVPLCIVGARVQGGHSTFWQMVLLMWLTTFLGNFVGYLLGSWGGYPLIHKLAAWLRLRPERLEQMERWFRRYGLWLTLGTRWLNWGFAQNMWLCGISRVRLGLFLPLMAVNDLIWAIAWTYAASAFIRKLPNLLRHAGSIAAIGLTIAILVAAGVLWWRRRREQRRSRQVQ